MAKFVYIDETGSSGKAAKRQPHLTVAAAIVDETMVQPLREGLHAVAWKHLGWLPVDLEFHGQEIWNGTGHWSGKCYDQLIVAYEDAMQVLDICDIDIAHASIHKARHATLTLWRPYTHTTLTSRSIESAKPEVASTASVQRACLVEFVDSGSHVGDAGTAEHLAEDGLDIV